MQKDFLILALGLCLSFVGTSPTNAFVRGDVDNSGSADLGDVVQILSSQFGPAATPLNCPDAGDVNDDGQLNITDPIYLLSFLFSSGAQPLPPFPMDGSDPTSDGLDTCFNGAPLPIDTIAQGSESNFAGSNFSVISDSNSWAQFWASHSNDPLPTVDFSSEMVIAIIQSFDNAGVTYNIDSVVDNGSELEIDYTAVYPGVFFPQSIQVHHFVKTTLNLKTPVFTEHVIALP